MGEKEFLLLAGDIGGTKTNLGLFALGKRRPILKAMETYSSREAPSLEHLLDRFLQKHPFPVSHAAFGIAGPVIKGRSKPTNLTWKISEEVLLSRFNWEWVGLINDLTAIAYAVPFLTRRELFPLNPVKAVKGAQLGLIAPGTGLGMSLLLWGQGRYLPTASEGGHADFAPRNEEEVLLWRTLSRQLGHVSLERVLSGPGLINIYNWLKSRGRDKEPAWLKERIRTGDAAQAISDAALAKKHPLCLAALNRFVSILGASAGNLALVGFTLGGIYLGGGIPPKILPKLKEPLFMEAFVDKGRFKEILSRIPVWVILNDKAPLLGTAVFAANKGMTV